MRCEICGREFDPADYQVLLPEATESFDTFECAVRARESRRPTSRDGALEREDANVVVLPIRRGAPLA